MLLADLMIFCTLGTIGPTNFKNSESRLFERKCGADLSWYRTFLLPNCLFQRCWNVFNSAFIKSRYPATVASGTGRKKISFAKI
jgi:hypothetical protein